MVLAKMASDQKRNIADQTNRFGFYTHANQPAIMGITRISDEGEGNGGWDNNVTTQHRYTAQVALRYIANNIAPTIDVKTNTISVSNNKEVYSTYNPNNDFVNPGENIAYNILIGNSNLSNTQTIEAGSKVVMILPQGISYLGYGHKADGTVEDYPFLDAVVSVNDANGNTILIWNVNTTINKNTNKTFRIRVSTENYKFTTYRSEALFVPKQTIEQKFFDDELSVSNEYRNLGYVINSKDISAILADVAGIAHYVSDNDLVDVYGVLGVSAMISEKDTVTNNVVTSRDTVTELVLSHKDNEIDYTLNVTSTKLETTLEQLAIINRLPSVNDALITSTRERGSEAAARLVDAGHISVTWKEDDSTAEMTLAPNRYEIFYFFGSADDHFTDADYTNGAVAGRWLTLADVLNAGLSLNTATVFKVDFADDVLVGGLGFINVHFKAKLDNYLVTNLKAINNFGYNAKVGRGQFDLVTEVLPIAVSANVYYDRAVITKNLIDDTDTPLRDQFSFTLTGKNTLDEVEYTQNFSIQTTERTANGWSGSLTLENLPLDLTYVLSENIEHNFAQPQITTQSVVVEVMQNSGTLLLIIRVNIKNLQ